MDIRKGEQFLVPFEIKVGEDNATPQDIDGLRIKIADRLCEWPDGELTFDDVDGVWLYPLTEAQSLTLFSGKRQAQVAVKIGDSILKSDVISISVKDSIIKERWTGDDDG